LAKVAEVRDDKASTVQVKVSFLGDMRSIVGQREVFLVLQGGVTLAELLGKLVARYGDGFRRRIFNERGELLRHVVVFINGRDARERGGLEAVLDGEDIDILLLPVFEGG